MKVEICDYCKKEIVNLDSWEKLRTSRYHLIYEEGLSEIHRDFCNLNCLVCWIGDKIGIKTEDAENKETIA